MRRFVRGLALLLGGLVLLFAVSAAITYIASEVRFNRTYTIDVVPVAIPTDPESIAFGEHIANIRGCKACHGEDLSGRIEAEDPMIGLIANANLTGGAGSEVIGYTVEDWDRAIRHGVGPDGKPLIIMPSRQHNVMSDADLGALIAYILSLPPVDNELPELELSLIIRAFYVATGMEGLIVPAEAINHGAPRPPSPAPGITAEYGRYLAGLCTICHGEGFSGGYIPGIPPAPGEPAPLNLTPAGELSGWTFEEFLTAMRTGITPGGRQIDGEWMPYETIFGDMTDDEWEAIWLFLQTLPPRETGNR